MSLKIMKCKIKHVLFYLINIGRKYLVIYPFKYLTTIVRKNLIDLSNKTNRTSLYICFIKKKLSRRKNVG